MIIKIVADLNKHLIIIILILGVCINAYGQDKSASQNNWIKLGIDFGISYMNPEEINSLFDCWYNSVGVVVEDEFFKGIHLGISATGYIALVLFNVFEIRPQFQYSYAPYLVMIEEAGDLDVKIVSLAPGGSANFILGPVRIGGGIFRYYSVIDWKDSYYQFDGTWKGGAIGYDAFIGLNKIRSKHFGWSFTFIYHYAVIDELTNSNDQTVIIVDENKNLALDLSGYEFKFGFNIGF